MRLILGLSLALLLSACGKNSSNGGAGPCEPNGVGHITTEQRWTTDADPSQTTKSYRQTNLSESRNFYGHRYFLLKDGNYSSDNFDGKSQPVSNDALTVDWLALKMLSVNGQGKQEANKIQIKTNSKIVNVNLSLGRNISKYDIVFLESELQKLKNEIVGKSGNGISICSVDELTMELAKSEDNPRDLAVITYIKLNIFAEVK